MRFRKGLLAVLVTGAMAIPATALASPPDNRPPGDRGGGHSGQTQGQSQTQSQCLLVISLLQPANC